MNRQEHMDWCKERALELLDSGDVQQAVTSMLSDLNKHDETKLDDGGALGMLGLMAIQSGDPGEARRFITGFN